MWSSTVARAPERWPPRQQYTSGRQSRAVVASSRSTCAAMLRATSTAPRLRASKADICVYSVPTRTRSSSFSEGQLTAPGR